MAQPSRPESYDKKVALVLQGGGALGSYQAGVYSAVMHYLKAIDATGTDEAKAVIAQMKAMPIHDVFAAQNGIDRCRTLE